MLNEDGLLVVVALIACALLTLGTLELVWPSQPRRPRGRPSAGPRGRPSASRDLYRRARARPVPAAPELSFTAPPPMPTPAIDVSSATPAPEVPEAPEPVVVAVTRTDSEDESPAPPAVVTAVVAPEVASDAPMSPAVASPTALSETPPEERPRRVRTPRRSVLTEPRPAAPSPIVAASVQPSPEVEPEGPAVDRAFALVAAERFDEAATLARQALTATKSQSASAPTVEAARERARLWGVVGLARKGLDDVDEARFAFEEAMAVAPRGERETWEGHLVALVLSVGRRSLDGIEDDSRPERIVSLRAAVEWLERGLVVAPGDLALTETLAAVRDAIWPAHESVLEALIKRQQFAEARRMLDEAIADPECPAERQRALRRLLHRTSRRQAQAAVEAAGHQAT